MVSSGLKSSLQNLLDSQPAFVDYLYNETKGPHSRTNSRLAPVPIEFTNWRDEQRAWRETAILFDQTHHMPQLFLKGPGAFQLLNGIGINSFIGFVPGKAKQFVACTPRGYVIGDCILYCHAEDDFELISGMPLLNWVHFQAERSALKVSVERENPTSTNPTGRRVKFRFGLDGPNAAAIFAELVGGEPPEIKFFNFATVKIAGCDVVAMRHGMAGHRGVEISGAFDDGPRVRKAVLAAGENYGLRAGGLKAYFSSVLESGYIGYPLPAIYTGEELRAYREWLSSSAWEAQFQIGGSFYSERIDDYYSTPWDLGYERILKFDHDFIGRESLQRHANGPTRTKVTMVWNKDDVGKILQSLLEPGVAHKYLELPVADYSLPHRDKITDEHGRLVGHSMHCGYSANEHEFLSIAAINKEFAAPGTNLLVTWGEPNGGSRKPQVEHHRQIKVRATVAPAPYAQFVRAKGKEALKHRGDITVSPSVE